MEDRSGRVGGQESRARAVCWQEDLGGPGEHPDKRRAFVEAAICL